MFALVAGFALIAAPVDQPKELPEAAQKELKKLQGKWKGVKLSALLDAVKPKAAARYVMFHCADPMEEDGTSPYYESIDMDDAYHAQTILAYELNDQPLPVGNGAPLRLRVERQLGYKQAKYIMRIELVESFASIAGGKGGYWEDQGYEWYAGI